MCGRYVLALTKKEIEAFFGVAVANMMVEPRYNIAPTTKIPVVRNMEGQKELTEMRWSSHLGIKGKQK